MLTAMLLMLAMADGTATPPRPAPDAATWVRADDYPPAALREGRGGTTRALVTVERDGSVAECVVAQSSGHADLDWRTCVVLSLRGRFEPGRDDNGRRHQAQVVVPIRWVPNAASGVVE